MRRRLAEQLRQQALKEQKEESLPEIVIEVKKKRGRPYGNLRRATEQHS